MLANRNNNIAKKQYSEHWYL